jgi:hypothetical protein
MLPDKCALILTSSVRVSAPNTALSDPEEREKQYLDAILFFIKESPLTKIIVCDNSGYRYPTSLYELAASHQKKIELLSFQGDQAKVKERGKGYGEGEIMEFIMAHSLLMREVDGLIKVTGRLKVVNIGKIWERMRPSENYFMPVSLLRPRWLVPRAARPCVDVRMYYTTTVFFNEVLLDAYKEVSDERIFFLEHAYHRAMTLSSRKVKCFPTAPEITGISGSNGWTFSERSPIKKGLIRLASFLGYIKPLYR